MYKKLNVFLFAVILLITGASILNTQSVNPSQVYQRGMTAMLAEDWYAAAESFIEVLRLNQNHAEATAALAECYYELGEYDEALSWARRARTLNRGNMNLAGLEAFTLIAMGRLDEASALISEILAREPNNREALFAAAELDIARGRAGDAVARYREASRRFPDDRRLLVSMALVLGSLGDAQGARSYIERALVQHPGDFRVYYYAAYLASREGRIREATEYTEYALYYRPGFVPAISLMASLHYRSGRFEDAIQLADELIAINREDAGAWYLKGMSLTRRGRNAEAITVLSTASGIAPNDEFIRYALEELLISTTRVEDPRRAQWASWHFSRARDFRTRNLIEQALFEYRRGLRLNPYARDRREYADLLRLQGYPARYLEELRFLQDLGLSDTALDDAVESYEAVLGTALFRSWGIDPVNITKPHWRVAVFSIASQSAFIHADAGTAGAAYIREILVHERNILPMNLEIRQASFSDAFRTARENRADYFLLVSISENERDISIRGEFFVARTGAPAAVFHTFRAGQDRLRNASRHIVDQMQSALPFRAELIARRPNEGLIDKGRADGVRDGTVYDIVRRGSMEIQNQGIGVNYPGADVLGKLTINRADEEVSSGSLERVGFFDRISPGDEVFLVLEAQSNVRQPGAVSIQDPELRNLLRMFR